MTDATTPVLSEIDALVAGNPDLQALIANPAFKRILAAANQLPKVQDKLDFEMDQDDTSSTAGKLRIATEGLGEMSAENARLQCKSG